MGRIYLQEKTHIVGMHPNRRLFAKEIVDYCLKINNYEKPDPWRNLGIWEFVGMTGRWSQVMGVYECPDGWNTLSAMIVQTQKQPSAELAATYRAVNGLRSGGCDEILESLDGCPSYEDLKGQQPDRSLLVVDQAQVQPGKEEDYGEAVLREWLPIMEDHGHQLAGHYKGALTDGMVITYWATSVDNYARLKNTGLEMTWRKKAIPMRRTWRQELWTAAPRSVFSDPNFDYGDTDIRDA